ncbi:hypothetical protein G9272_44640 [Streptomyces asoensis]|uniref:Uncharacterized protein n=1 Tax=Streptomyces asoensis TaxID=249586 RepID=A0A6M4WEC7_9ACTN|nr:hypothetical protein [Streptomyces asoensis]QJS98899.1 hypothetical protein G9272_00255 [Streptomyces asoensis]QJS98929.1 hypothetical protein G9272_44640 [Streptomyces asoensis]
MVAFHSSALNGVAANPALPTPLLLRLIAFDGAGANPALPPDAMAVVMNEAGVPA